MFQSSELILNPDGSIYHLALKPDDIAHTIITVGDPERVKLVSGYFDELQVVREKREFHTHTGVYKGKRITVISTGIGTDNIDIVLNELDALVNIDLDNRQPAQQQVSLNIIRIGTSGSLRKEIPVDSFLISEFGIGFDNLLHFYESGHVQEKEIGAALSSHMARAGGHSAPYVVKGNASLINAFYAPGMFKGATVTNSGFYGPQGRQLRAVVSDREANDKLFSFSHPELQITNLEMETAGIYGLSALLGHKAVSLNCILANRESGSFSAQGGEKIDELIQYTLEVIANSQLF